LLADSRVLMAICHETINNDVMGWISCQRSCGNYLEPNHFSHIVARYSGIVGLLPLKHWQFLLLTIKPRAARSFLLDRRNAKMPGDEREAEEAVLKKKDRLLLSIKLVRCQ